ncbi:MAG: hypothetical protein JWP25_6504 [Bradyrhizobium sp.]|nr:hypothetical protein [Bradyrhizobium sp.]
MMGARDKFDRALPDLETYLEGEIAAGEISETRLTFGLYFFHGLYFLKQRFLAFNRTGGAVQESSQRG